MSQLAESVVCETVSCHLCNMMAYIVNLNHHLFVQASFPTERIDLITAGISINESSRIEQCPFRQDCHNVEPIGIPKDRQHMFLSCNCSVWIIRGVFNR
jgi:hypothetical protein